VATDPLTGGYEILRPGEIITIGPQPGYGPISGQVLAVDTDSITIAASPSARLPGGVVERIPTSRIASVTREGELPLTSTIVRTYKGEQQADAIKAFQAEATALARAGYEPSSQSWAQGQWGFGAFLVALLLFVLLIGILVFLYLLVVKPEGTLTVTYTRGHSPSVEPEVETRVCPRCAETVKAAALVCRYCGHEFEPAPGH
jgi:hypothetical protein